MAALAAEAGLLPDHLLTSPADRARETAHEFAKAFGFPLPRIRHDDRAYLAERPQLVAILRGAPDAARRVLLVGHNPGLSELAEWLTGEDVGNLPTASVYVAAGALERWSDLSHGAFGRTRYDWPR
jgi:phosphohistidine phosphatase